MATTTSRLLDGIKRRISNPANQVLLLDDDYLALANDVMRAYIVPLLLSVRQDYFVILEETTLVANQEKYDIPYRAIGRGLRDLRMRDAGGSVRDLNLVTLEDAYIFPLGVTPHSFYFQGDKVVLVPMPTASGLTLQMWYNLAPSKLVQETEAGLVTTIAGDTVTVASVPSSFTSGVVIDFVQAKSGNSVLDMDIAIAGVSGTQISFASGDVPTSLVVGDYIALANTTPVVPMPNEVYPYLETQTCIRALQALGDLESMKALQEQASEEVKLLKMLLEPRIIGENTKIVNRRSLLRGVRSRYRRGLIY